MDEGEVDVPRGEGGGRASVGGSGDLAVNSCLLTSAEATEPEPGTAGVRARADCYRNFLALSTDGIGRVELRQSLPVDLPEHEQVAHILRHAYLAEANEGLARNSGHASAAEVVGRELAELIPADPQEVELIRRFVRSGYRLLDDEQRRLGQDGAVRWLRQNWMGVVAEGRLVRAWVVSRDETARKQAELDHEEQRAFLRQVLDTDPHLVMARDSRNRLTLANRAVAELYGTTVDALGARLSGETVAGGPVGFGGDDLEVMHSGRERATQMEVADAAGTQRWFDVVKRPLLGADGAPTQVVSVATEVTARVHADEERSRLQTLLQEAAREWRETFDAIDVGILVTNDAGHVVRANRAAAMVVGEGAGFAALLHRPLEGIGSREPWRAAAQLRALAQRERRHTGRQIRDAATGRSWYLTASPMTRGEGAGAWVIVTMRDVTAETEVERELRRSRQMEAMGALVAGVAHEVRTPLFSISASLEAFASEFGIRPEQEEYASLLRSQVQRLTRLMSDLLDYGKPPVLSLSAGGVTEAVQAAIRACTGLAEECGVAIEVELDEGLPPIHRDLARLEQVFQNLIANAIQHSPAGASVRVESRAARQPPGGVCFTVEDRGPGIPPRERRRIFEPFVSGRPGGTGLGLSIVQRIVEGHGGSVSAGNRPEGGAVFTVLLPPGGDEALQEVPTACC